MKRKTISINEEKDTTKDENTDTKASPDRKKHPPGDQMSLHILPSRYPHEQPSQHYMIPSSRMATPGLASNHPPPPNVPGQCTARVRPCQTNFVAAAQLTPHVISTTYRHKIITSATGHTNTTFIPNIISVEDSNSSSSEIESETEGEQSDSTSQHSCDTPPPLPCVELPEIKKECQKYDNRATMRTGLQRGAPVVIVIPDTPDDNDDDEDDDDDDITEIKPDGSPHKIKAKMTIQPVPEDEIPQDNISFLLGEEKRKTVNEEEANDLQQFSLKLVNMEEVINKFSQISVVAKKCRRVNHRALYQSVKHGDMNKVVANLSVDADPCEPMKGTDGRTALHVAAMKGNLEILMLLLFKTGIEKIDIVDNGNRTPLFWAIEKKQLHITRFLINSGADILVLNNDGMSLLHVAARNGPLSLVKWLLHLGADINHQDHYGWSALMWATERDANSNIIKYLVCKGACTNLLDKEENICLHWAAMVSSLACVNELVDNAVYSHINATNMFGETALHVAAKGDSYNIVNFLLSHGADPNIKNNNGYTPLGLCQTGSKTFHCIRIRNMVDSTTDKTSLYIGDISKGKERIPISCINEVDEEPFPCNFTYIVSSEESAKVKVTRGLASIEEPCKCTDVCGHDCKCLLLSNSTCFTEDGKLDLRIFNDNTSILSDDKRDTKLNPIFPVIYECTDLCACSDRCLNRVSQKGVTSQLQVFRTKTKGWGVRMLSKVERGSHLLSYVGEIITLAEAARRSNDSHLFQLPNNQSESKAYCMDALRYGNCARFVNHSCQPNLIAVQVFTNHRDARFPEIAFFACKDIKAGEELSFDYGDTFWRAKNSNRVWCQCASKNCRYSHPHIDLC